MKKVLLTAATAALALGANAQQTRYGIEIGAHLGNLVQELPERSESSTTSLLNKEHIDARPNLGLRAGFVADLGISDNFSIQPGLQFVMKGARNEISLDEGDNTNGFEYQEQSLINLNYIELPINIQYKTREDGTGFFVGAGPYFGYAISGKRSLQIDSTLYRGGSRFHNDVDIDDELSFGDNKNDDYKNLDIGLGVNAGYMLPMGAFVRAYGQYGFSNIFPVPEAKYETKNYGFGISFGYMFGGKKGTSASDDPTEATD
jgi:hypothetical protein